MATINEAAAEFLSHKRVAVTGVSRTPKNHGSNTVYKRLRDRGYHVFAVNPNAERVEGDRVWMHRGAGAGSVSDTAAAYGRDHGINVIDGGRPCMFGPTADFGHKTMRALLTLTGSLPRQV